MARAKMKESRIDQPSEELIDLADSRISEEAIAEFGDAGEGLQTSPKRGGALSALSGLPFLLAGMVLSMIVVVWLLFINTQSYPVITRGNPIFGIEVVVDKV